jgi:hypothetical protein
LHANLSDKIASKNDIEPRTADLHRQWGNEKHTAMNEIFQRLKQPKLVQRAIAHVATAFALLQGIDIVAQQFGVPRTVRRKMSKPDSIPVRSHAEGLVHDRRASTVIFSSRLSRPGCNHIHAL